jgi:hypothetical protein
MSNPNPDAELALHQLGQRIRQGFAKKHPVRQQSLEAVKEPIREQYEQEQELERRKTPTPDAGRAPEPPEPEL